jgi:microcystin-dependent protein
MTVANFEGPIANLPFGSIISWHDAAETIPVGWALCDGNNGTPNLIETFPKSVPDSATDPGTTGGQNTVTLSESQLPSHSHSAGSTDTGGEHNHKIGRQVEANNNGNPGWYSGNQKNTSSTGAHTHTTAGTAAQGGGASIDNQPAYEETLFIKRID